MKPQSVLIAKTSREPAMRIKTRMTIWASCFCLAFGLLPFGRAATIQIGSSNVVSGDAFSVPLWIDSGTDALGCFLVDIAFDPSVLQITGVEGEGAFSDGFLANTNNPGQVIFLGLNLSSLTSPTGAVLVARLSFVAVGSPGSSSTLEFAGIPEICNTDGIDLPVSAMNGIVNVRAPSIDQLVPCGGPATGGTWKNHGQYVAALTKAVELYYDEGLIEEAEKDAIIRRARHSDCGSRIE